MASPTITAPVGPASAAAQNSVYTPAPAANVRRPRGFLRVNGQNIALIELQTSSATSFSADTWSARTGLWAPPGMGLSFWDELPPATVVDVCFGFLTKNQNSNEFPKAGNFETVLTGLIDDIKPNLSTAEISLSGRDLTARLIDAKTSNLYLNSTASQAVTSIAKQFSLTPQVTPTYVPIGKFAGEQFAATTGATAYWDLVTAWARHLGWDAYVTGTTLFFGPVAEDTSPWKFYMENDGTGSRHWANVQQMELVRNANLSKDITVTVRSHSSKTGKSISATASRTGTRVPTSSRSSDADSVANYVFTKPGLTEQQAQAWANSKLATLSSWEREASVSLEGQPGLTVRKQFLVAGTDSGWDTSYYIKTISRSWDLEEGYVMGVSGRTIPDPNTDAGAVS